jgi:hypothetical protein
VTDIEQRVAALGNCPTDPVKNAAYRQKVRDLGDSDPAWAAAIWQRCENDPVYYINTFAWSQNPKDFPQDPEQPIILFPKQALYIRTLDEHIETGKPMLLEKSREQLASVGTANYCAWRWTFKENASIKIGSMKEELVDGDDFATQIMPKIDFTLAKMPAWIKPAGYTAQKPFRTDMKMRNPVTGRVIKGEATNKHFSVGGRYAFVWLDEFSKVENQDSIHRKVANTTNCFLYTTTPEGYEKFAMMAEGGHTDVFRLHWTSNYLWHPKGYTPEQCDWDNGIWPEKWLCQPGCPFHTDGGKPHSERFDAECLKLQNNPKDVAQELEIDYHKSGASVFDIDKVTKSMHFLRENKPEFDHYRLEFIQPDNWSMKSADPDEWYYAARDWKVKAIKVPGGPLRVLKDYVPFNCRDAKCICKGTGLHTYCLGGDTCKNVDGDYDVAYIKDVTTGDIVAEWFGRASAGKLGIEWAMLCKWFGSSTMQGAPDAWAAVEWNEGVITLETMDKLGIFLHVSRSEDKIRKKRGPYLGVVVTAANKARLVKRGLQQELEIPDPNNPLFPIMYCPFVEFWEEASTFVYKVSDTGEAKPDRAKMGAQTRKQHDDRVMAMVHACYGAVERFGMMRGYVDLNTPVAHRLIHSAA